MAPRKRNYDFQHIYPALADAKYASLDEAFIVALKPIVKLLTSDEQAREILRLDEEPVREKDKVA